MNPFFFVIFGPLMLPSWILCGENSSVRTWQASWNQALDPFQPSAREGHPPSSGASCVTS